MAKKRRKDSSHVRVIVTPHALEQARRRFNPERMGAAPEEWISRQVAAAIVSGRMHDRKPTWARLFHEPKRSLPPGQRFVYEPNEQCGWIVAMSPSGNPDEWVVVTSLSRLARVR